MGGCISLTYFQAIYLLLLPINQEFGFLLGLKKIHLSIFIIYNRNPVDCMFECGFLHKLFHCWQGHLTIGIDFIGTD